MAAGGSRPIMASEVMDFPEPDSPTKPSTSPGAIENERLRTAATGAAAFACWAGGGACPARDCGNWMVRSRTSSSGRTRAMVSALRLLLWPRFRRHQPGNAVIHYQLAVVFSRVLDKTPRHVGNSHLLIRKRIDDQITHSIIALLLDRRRAVGERLLHKLNHRGFRLVLLALGIFFRRRFQSHRRVG